MPSRELQAFVRDAFTEQAKMTVLPSNDVWRQGYEAFGAMYPAEPGVAPVAVDAGGVKAAWLAASGVDAGRTVLFFHGGGYVLGSITTHVAITSRLTGAAGGRVLAVDYRLAPEHPFPAAVEDCVGAWRWLLARGQDPRRAAFVGDSAGGGLVVATMLAARAAGLPLPACGAPISPWFDLVGGAGWRAVDPAVDPIVAPRELDRMTADYMAGADPAQPHASPLFGDLSGLPPLLIQVGTAEILLPDSTLFADKARAAGVAVTLDIEEGAPHVWHHAAPTVPEAVAAIGRIGAFIRRHAG